MRSLKLMLLSILIFSSFAEIANCQVLFGIKGGANITKGVFEGETANYALKYHFGILSQIYLSDKASLRLELLYSKKGWNIPKDALNNNVSIILSYLNLPVLIEYKANKNLSLFTGPEFGYKLDETRNPKGFVPDYEKFDLGLILGASYAFNSKFGVDLRYVLGFKVLLNEDIHYTDYQGNVTSNGKMRDGSNRAIMLGIYYIFNNPKNTSTPKN